MFAVMTIARLIDLLPKAKTTPAMAAGIESYPWTIRQLCELLE